MLSEKITALSSIFAAFKEIQAVYLFGSYATGKASRDSDLDLGLVCDTESVSAETKLLILAEITKRGFDKIDLVVISENDLFLAHEVIKQHLLLYKRADFCQGSYFSKITRMYLDFIPVLELQAKALKERVLNKGKV